MLCRPTTKHHTDSDLLHIANTQFEWELCQQRNEPLLNTFERHPLFLQLQFLPVLYAHPQDRIAVTQLPPESFLNTLKTRGFSCPQLHLLSEKSFNSPLKIEACKIEPWGASSSISKWAHTNLRKQHVLYNSPPIDVVRRVHSKEFSFTHSPQLSGACLIHNEEEFHVWQNNTEDPKVLKTCFGMSGKGHLVFAAQKKPNLTQTSLFLKQQWQAGLPVVGEPWVHRLLDFSTQWNVCEDRSIHFIGVTRCDNDAFGHYRSNTVGPVEKILGKHAHFLEEHLVHAQAILEKIASLGYFGNVGIDAMVYVSKNEVKLHPIVEINARKTMGFVALKTAARMNLNKESCLRISLQSSQENGWLPSTLTRHDGVVITFPKQLELQVLL